MKQKKHLKELKKSTSSKLEFIRKQIMTIEYTMEDIKFTQVVKDSNRVIEKLTKDIDLEELRIAKEYQEQGKIRREELNSILDDNDEDDKEIRNELDRIERDMIQSEFNKNKASQPIFTSQVQAQTSYYYPAPVASRR